MEEKKSYNSYRRLLTYLGPYKIAFAIATLGNLLYAAMDVAFLSALEPLTNKGLIGQDLEFMKLVPLYIIAIVFIRSLGAFISGYFMGWIGQNIVQNMRQQLIDSYVHLPCAFYDKNSSGQLLSKVTYNTQQVANACTDALTKLFREGGMIIFAISMLFYTNWKLTLIFLVSAPVIGLIVKFASKRFKRISKNIQNAMGNVTQTAQEIIDGYKVVKTCNSESYESERFEKVVSKNKKQMIKLNLTKSFSTPMIQLIASTAIALVIFYAAFLLAKNELNAGQFVFMLSTMMAILKPLKVISNINSVIQQGITAADSVFEIMDTNRELDDGDILLNDSLSEITFKNVSFSYPDSQNKVLDNVSFSLPKGKTVALVGHSGSGKSTLTSLLLRFYGDFDGQILFDSTPIQSFQLKDLRSQVAYVSQEVVLFDDTVRANIAYGVKEVDEDALMFAAKQAHALEFIDKMEEGFDTNIGENGNRLSGGQRQRIAIARAIYKNSPIIILDEATSALDTKSERHIQNALEALTKNRTTLVIAHRLSTIENADNIVVMEQGKIVEQGSHKSLLAKQSFYAKLHAMQFKED